MPSNAYAIKRPEAVVNLADIAMARKDPSISLRAVSYTHLTLPTN